MATNNAICLVLFFAALQLLSVHCFLVAVGRSISGGIKAPVEKLRRLPFFNLAGGDQWPLFKSSNITAYEESFRKLDEVDSDMRRVRPRLMARLVAWALRRIVRGACELVSGLEVKVLSDSNRGVIRGALDTIEMKFDKISYATLHISGGGRVVIKDLRLWMRRFLFRASMQSVRKPYAIYFDALLTQQDIVNSQVIRNLIQLLVDIIFERVLNVGGVLDAKIAKVTIHSRRISIKGTAELKKENRNTRFLLTNSVLGLDGAVDFEVSTGVGVRKNGQTLYLKDIQVALNPDSSLRTSLPILTSTPIDVDLGEDCRIQSLVIGNRNIWIRAASVVSPVQPFHVVEAPRKALYHYDISAFLSSLLTLKGGWLGAAVGWDTSV